MIEAKRGFIVKLPDFAMRENEIRKKNLRKVKDFRQRLGITQPTYNKIKRGERVDASIIEKIKERNPHLKYTI